MEGNGSSSMKKGRQDEENKENNKQSGNKQQVEINESDSQYVVIKPIKRSRRNS